jgi:excisionase family DNA binding protein
MLCSDFERGLSCYLKFDTLYLKITFMDEFKQNEELPMLIPYMPAEFWAEFRRIVREELKGKSKGRLVSGAINTTGMSEKPLYKIVEICELFNITRTTVHEWVKSGRLRKIKVSSRVYFLGTDIQKILSSTAE